MPYLLITQSHLCMMWETHCLFLQLLICKPLQIHPRKDHCPELSPIAYSVLLVSSYFPVFITYKF